MAKVELTKDGKDDALKLDNGMGCNHLEGCDGDRINADIATAGCNFSFLFK